MYWESGEMNVNEPGSHPEDEPRSPGDIELRVDADPSHLSVIRAVAGNLAMGQDFDLDTIADLKLAVDEVCSVLITRATTGATLVCRFAVTADEITVHASTLTRDDVLPGQESFGWKVLTTLTDTARSWVDRTVSSNGQCLAHISIAKRRAVHG